MPVTGKIQQEIPPNNTKDTWQSIGQIAAAMVAKAVKS